MYKAVAGPDHDDARQQQRDPQTERVVRQPFHRVDRRQRLDERADEHGVRNSPDARHAAERPREEQHGDPDGDVRRPKSQERVVRETLVQHIPR